MRLLLSLVVLALVNGGTYVLLTQPASNELERLGERQQELDGVLAVEEKTAAKWNRLAELVETAESVLEPLRSGESSAQSSLRQAFLEAEEGLELRRDALEFRPETRLPRGFGGVRIRVMEAGRFADLVSYLSRISQLKIPMAPVEMSLAKSATGPAPLLLSVTLSALWPEESSE
jgi:hypothetical protein